MAIISVISMKEYLMSLQINLVALQKLGSFKQRTFVLEFVSFGVLRCSIISGSIYCVSHEVSTKGGIQSHSRNKGNIMYFQGSQSYSCFLHILSSIPDHRIRSSNFKLKLTDDFHLGTLSTARRAVLQTSMLKNALFSRKAFILLLSEIFALMLSLSLY